jgi:hypothetical protein
MVFKKDRCEILKLNKADTRGVRRYSSLISMAK